MAEQRTVRCPECAEEVSAGITRRDFVKGVGTAVAAASAGVLRGLVAPARAAARIARRGSPEGAVKRLYDTLNADQKQAICFPWQHELRQKYSANWAITKPTIGEFFNADQQATIREIFRGITSGEGHDRFLRQMDEDAGGFDRYHVAIFGEPGGETFEWVLTGRHVTIRCDGNFGDGTAFGGPIVYGHGAGDSEKGLPGNVFYYQTLRANEVFGMLDGKQRERALVDRAPAEDAIALRGADAKFPGIPVSELSSDQKELVHKVMHDLLAPYREEDVREAISCLTAGGGMDKIHLAFYKQGDIGSDEIWDIWRLEGPSFVWHFRGSPHVHTYINIASKTS